MSDLKADLPLLSVKTALGPPVHLDYRALDVAEAHRRLGEHVRAQVHHILLGKIQASAPEALAGQVRLARYCQAAMSRKLANSGEEILRSALEEYVTCLTAWEQGDASSLDIAQEKLERVQAVLAHTKWPGPMTAATGKTAAAAIARRCTSASASTRWPRPNG